MSHWLGASSYRREYGRRLAAARVDAGLTQAELGAQIGLTRASVCNIEAGRQGQLAEQVLAAARATRVDPCWLLTGRPEQTAAALLTAGWLPVTAMDEMIQAEVDQEVLAALLEPVPVPSPEPVPEMASKPAASLPTPPALSRFVAENGWTLMAREAGVREIWDLPRARARVMIPFATDYIDWELRWIDTLCMIKTVYRWDDETLALNLARYGT